jgi:hypothetical protein
MEKPDKIQREGFEKACLLQNLKMKSCISSTIGVKAAEFVWVFVRKACLS